MIYNAKLVRKKTLKEKIEIINKFLKNAFQKEI